VTQSIIGLQPVHTYIDYAATDLAKESDEVVVYTAKEATTCGRLQLVAATIFLQGHCNLLHVFCFAGWLSDCMLTGAL
jgi:hypothetical protein